MRIPREHVRCVETMVVGYFTSINVSEFISPPLGVITVHSALQVTPITSRTYVYIHHGCTEEMGVRTRGVGICGQPSDRPAVEPATVIL